MGGIEAPLDANKHGFGTAGVDNGGVDATARLRSLSTGDSC